MADFEFDPVVVGEIFPFVKPSPSFVGDDVHTAFDKINTAFDFIQENGLGEKGPGNGEYIDTNIEYTNFFKEDLKGWTASNGTLVISSTEPSAVWTAGANDTLYNNGVAIDTKRFTHLVVWVERLSPGAWTPNQKATSKNTSRGYDFTGHGVNPLRNPTPMAVGEKMYVSFELAQISDWYSVGANGVAFRLALEPGVYKLWGLKIVGPDSSEVQIAAVQAQIAKDLAEAAEDAAKTWRDAAEVFSQSAEQFSDQSQGYAADSLAYRNAAKDYRDESQQFSIESEKQSLLATASGRFSHYLKPHANATYTFEDGTTQGITSNGTLTIVGGSLHAEIPTVNGYIETQDINFLGSDYSKIMVRMRWISGTLDSTVPFQNCFLYYSTTSRGMNANFQMMPLAYEVLKLNDANIVNLYFDATEQSGTGDDWFGSSQIRRLRLYPAINAAPITFEIEYFYLLSEDINYPYKQATASANSASEAAAFENSAQQWAGAAEISSTEASTSAASAQTYAGQASTSATTAEGWSAEAQSYAVLAAQTAPGLQLTLNPVFMQWGAVAPLPTGFSVILSNSTYTKNIVNSIYSPQCLDISCPAADNPTRVWADSINVPKGFQALASDWYVLECDVQVVTGVLDTIHFYMERYFSDTTTDYQLFATNLDFKSNSGGRWTCSKLVNFPIPAGKTINRLTSVLYPSIGSSAAKRILVHKWSLRLASQEEIAAGTVQDTINASVSAEASLRIAADNTINAKYGVKINANGYVTGYGLIATANDGVPTSEMIFQVDKFKVATAGQTPKQMFAVGNVNGATTMVLNGNMIADGTITASKMVVTPVNNIVSFDPYWQDSAAWNVGGWTVIQSSGTQNAGGKYFNHWGAPNASRSYYWDNNKFPITATKDYELDVIVYQSLTTGRFYGVWHFWDYAGNPLLSTGVAGWPGVNASNFYFPSYAQGTGDYVQYKLSVGPNSPAKFPTGTAFASFGVLADYDGVGARTVIARAWMVEKAYGQLIVNGTITADKLNVNNLSAITANLGAVTAGSMNINGRFILGTDGTINISSASSGQRLTISNSLIRVFDASGVERVRLGIW